MRDLQLICFEVTDRCDLSARHDWCPASHPLRHAPSQTPATDEEFLAFLAAAVARGFRGLVGYHYYCEPTLDLPRCRRLSEGVHAMGLQTLCWTNGVRAALGDAAFDHVLVTQYPGAADGDQRIPYRPDHRRRIYDTPPVDAGPCYRPLTIELPIDHYGNLHLCCADWRGQTRIGSIRHDSPGDLLDRWAEAAAAAARGEPPICARCQGLERSPVCRTAGHRLLEDSDD